MQCQEHDRLDAFDIPKTDVSINHTEFSRFALMHCHAMRTAILSVLSYVRRIRYSNSLTSPQNKPGYPISNLYAY